jgi:coenzyme PQQ biosynthesis protein PqqD
LTTAEGQGDLLLIPEGALRLKGPARTILELCNGERPLSEIVLELRHRYPSEDASKIETEAIAFLTRMRDRCVLEET